MKNAPNKNTRFIWTIGHSTRPVEEFIALLQSFKIKLLVDIRSFPGSRKFPQFNKEALQITLAENEREYIHLKDLGGRRKAAPNSENTSWRSTAFRGYADYMETPTFLQSIQELEKLAKQQPTAYMCAEALWWRCHRALVSDYLKSKDWTVMHIMNIDKAQEHPYTSSAKIVAGALSYKAVDLKLF